ncbi:MAG: hypothetical protein R3E95_04845 [Thiolinea sp.]
MSHLLQTVEHLIDAAIGGQLAVVGNILLADLLHQLSGSPLALTDFRLFDIRLISRAPVTGSGELMALLTDIRLHNIGAATQPQAQQG